MDPFKIDSTNKEQIDDLGHFEEDRLVAVGRGKGGGGKSKTRGEKTLNSINESSKSNAVKNRKEEARKSLQKDLEHSPIKNINEEQISEAIKYYSDWVLKSINQGYPYISNIDKEIEYTQTRSSGPGGQNVNKTSTAVIAKHILTGISARSESREMLNNRSDSISKVLLNLENHVRNWKIFLSDVSSYLKKEKIILFMQKYLNEEVK